MTAFAGFVLPFLSMQQAWLLVTPAMFLLSHDEKVHPSYFRDWTLDIKSSKHTLVYGIKQLPGF
jgi:hypothetical protein